MVTGVPVGVIIIILASILFIVYNRSKKEAWDDNDPDFEGDVTCMSDLDHLQYNNINTSEESLEFKNYSEKHVIPPSNPFGDEVRTAHSSSSNLMQLPESIESSSLIEFAKQIHDSSICGYKVASSSRKNSEASQNIAAQLMKLSKSQIFNLSLLSLAAAEHSEAENDSSEMAFNHYL